MTVKLSCTLTGTGTTAATGTNQTSLNIGPFMVQATGAGTLTLQYSTDGTNWFAVSTDTVGTPASWIVASGTPVGVVGMNAGPEIQYRFNCTAYTSTLTCKILQGGQVVA